MKLRTLALGGSLIASAVLVLLAAQGCSSSSDNNGGNGDGGSDDGGIGFGDGCTGIRCSIATCSGGAKTTLSGTVFDPAGKTPLYNVIVYVPNEKPKPFDTGVSCDKCGGTLTGSPITTALTDTKGHFTLTNVPSGKNIPLVIQVGKWRRQVVVDVAECTDTTVDPDKSRLPRMKSEGDLPQIAMVTGKLDPLECLLRKIGIDDSEFTGPPGNGRVHMFLGYGGSAVGNSKDASQLYRSVQDMAQNDVVLLGCEGGEHPENKPQTALDTMFAYANMGGRVLMSHYHYYWLNHGPTPFPTVATFAPDSTIPTMITASIDTSFPKGMALAEWLVNVNASTTLGKLPINQARNDVSAVAPMTSQRWVYDDSPTSVQYFSFNTPLTVPADQKCGRIVFNDLHVASGDVAGSPPDFPGGCTTKDLSPQEKALEFMLFDLSSCIQTDNTPPMPPR